MPGDLSSWWPHCDFSQAKYTRARNCITFQFRACACILPVPLFLAEIWRPIIVYTQLIVDREVSSLRGLRALFSVISMSLWTTTSLIQTLVVEVFSCQQISPENRFPSDLSREAAFHQGASVTTTTTATKTPQICIFDNEKQYFCTLCTCIFLLLTF